MDNHLIENINQSLDLSLPEKLSADELRTRLTAHINHLINHDFEKLVFLLYRIDVDEARMRALLAHKEGEDTAELIANLVIERQLQKMESRRKYSGKENASGEEKW